MWFSVLLTAAALLVQTHAAKIPAAWKTCPRNLPKQEYATCVTNAVPFTISYILDNGVPSLNLPPLEPIKIPARKLNLGSGPFAIEISVRDVEVANFRNFELLKVRYDEVEKYRFGADMAYKKPVVLTANYELKGHVLLLPVTGKGPCRFQFDNASTSTDFVGEPFTKGKHKYVSITEAIFDFNAKKIHVQFDNLFNGNKVLGDSMNAIVNENWDIFFKDVKPVMSEILGAYIKVVTAHIFKSIPYDQIFPRLNPDHHSEVRK